MPDLSDEHPTLILPLAKPQSWNTQEARLLHGPVHVASAMAATKQQKW